MIPAKNLYLVSSEANRVKYSCARRQFARALGLALAGVGSGCADTLDGSSEPVTIKILNVDSEPHSVRIRARSYESEAFEREYVVDSEQRVTDENAFAFRDATITVETDAGFTHEDDYGYSDCGFREFSIRITDGGRVEIKDSTCL